MALKGKSPADTYKDLLQIDNNNNGIASTTKIIKDGLNNTTSCSLSDRRFLINSQTNNTTAFEVRNSSNANKFLVDTDNDYVKALGEHVNTQYAHFGVNAIDGYFGGALDDTHYMIPFVTSFANLAVETIANFAIGTATTSSFNDTEPTDSLTIATTSASVLPCYWYVPDDITIDKVEWFTSADAAAGTTIASYVMKYDLDKGNSAASGDLSGGVKVAYSGNVTNNGYEQIHYNEMTIDTPNVDAQQVVLFTFAYDDTEATDYGISATIKYHLR